jgi:hypothetical protein
MMQPKLTPTTNDQLNGNGHVAGQPTPLFPIPMKVTEAHEPIKEPGEPPWRFVTATGGGPELPQVINVVPAAEPLPLKVALIGTAPSSRLLAPFKDHSWKIWACSPGNMVGLERIDAWFEIHANMMWPENAHYGAPYLEWLNKQTFPIYMQSQEFVPNAIPFPMKEAVKEFGPYFFTSSFSWMMAFAMMQGAKEIALYGIDMASRDEYILQRPGAYYFFTEAQKRGVKITAPYESDIMQPPALYGYSEVTMLGRKLLARKKEIQDRIMSLRQQRDSTAQQVTYLEGALEDNDYVISIFGGAQSHNLPGSQG